MYNFNTTGTSKDFIESIAREIEEAAKSFWSNMTKEEKEIIKHLPQIAQRITFFNYYPSGANYKYYREALREWLLFGKVCREYNLPDWDKKLNLIEEGAAERVEELFTGELLAKSDFDSVYWYHNLIRDINGMREKLLAETPILTNDKIDIYDRRRLMKLALEADKYYMSREKEFSRMVNKVISTLITRYLYQ